MINSVYSFLNLIETRNIHIHANIYTAAYPFYGIATIVDRYMVLCTNASHYIIWHENKISHSFVSEQFTNDPTPILSVYEFLSNRKCHIYEILSVSVHLFLLLVFLFCPIDMYVSSCTITELL